MHLCCLSCLSAFALCTRVMTHSAHTCALAPHATPLLPLLLACSVRTHTHSAHTHAHAQCASVRTRPSPHPSATSAACLLCAHAHSQRTHTHSAHTCSLAPHPTPLLPLLLACSARACTHKRTHAHSPLTPTPLQACNTTRTRAGVGAGASGSSGAGAGAGGGLADPAAAPPGACLQACAAVQARLMRTGLAATGLCNMGGVLMHLCFLSCSPAPALRTHAHAMRTRRPPHPSAASAACLLCAHPHPQRTHARTCAARISLLLPGADIQALSGTTAMDWSGLDMSAFPDFNSQLGGLLRQAGRQAGCAPFRIR